MAQSGGPSSYVRMKRYFHQVAFFIVSIQSIDVSIQMAVSTPKWARHCRTGTIINCLSRILQFRFLKAVYTDLHGRKAMRKELFLPKGTNFGNFGLIGN